LDGANRGAELNAADAGFRRKQPLQPKVIDLNEVLPGMTTMLRRTLREDIRRRYKAGGRALPRFATNLRSRRHLNLANQCPDAMPNGGQLLIETANVHLDSAVPDAARRMARGGLRDAGRNEFGHGIRRG